MDDEFEVWHVKSFGVMSFSRYLWPTPYGVPTDVPESPFPGGYTSWEDLFGEGES